jgi:hypothetical protein
VTRRAIVLWTLVRRFLSWEPLRGDTYAVGADAAGCAAGNSRAPACAAGIGGVADVGRAGPSDAGAQARTVADLIGHGPVAAGGRSAADPGDRVVVLAGAVDARGGDAHRGTRTGGSAGAAAARVGGGADADAVTHGLAGRAGRHAHAVAAAASIPRRRVGGRLASAYGSVRRARSWPTAVRWPMSSAQRRLARSTTSSTWCAAVAAPGGRSRFS